MSYMKSSRGQLSDYQHFRLQRLLDKGDDDNLSAHFSNPLSNKTDREDDLHERVNPFRATCKETNRESQLLAKLGQKERQCNDAYAKYGELMKKYEQVERDAKYFKHKYQQKMAKDKQTKKKLEGWIQSAKDDLL